MNVLKYLPLLIIVSCSTQQGDQVGSHTEPAPEITLFNSTEQNRTGTYTYSYPHNTPDLNEDHYIVIETANSGRYYGTTDEFDDAREGYLPGFFMTDMNNLSFSGDTLRFTLDISNTTIFTDPISLNLTSNEAVVESGVTQWGIGLGISSKNYIGIFEDSGAIFFEGEIEFLDKRFTKE